MLKNENKLDENKLDDVSGGDHCSWDEVKSKVGEVLMFSTGEFYCESKKIPVRIDGILDMNCRDVLVSALSEEDAKEIDKIHKWDPGYIQKIGGLQYVINYNKSAVTWLAVK